MSVDNGKVRLTGTVRSPHDRQIVAATVWAEPGVIDVHLHFNEPGREDWEGAATGSRALAAGGGVAFFMGDQSRADFLNSLYDDGNGLFPVPLEASVPLSVDSSDKTPDLQVTDHPIFRIFAGQDNPFIKMVSAGDFNCVQKVLITCCITDQTYSQSRCHWKVRYCE